MRPDPIAKLAAAAASADVTVIDPGVLPVSDDFSHIAERVPAAFIAVGAGGVGCGAHHAPDFDIDERSIGLSADILTRAALAYLASRQTSSCEKKPRPPRSSPA